MKRNDIDRKFTDIVKKYLDDGYLINTKTFGGSDGTDRVDLRKGLDFVRVYIDYGSHNGYNILLLCVAGKTLEPDELSASSIWLDNLTEISCERYFCVDLDWYVPEDEKGFICDKRRERMHWRTYCDNMHGSLIYLTEKTNRIAWEFLKKQKGCKNVSLKDVETYKIISSDGKVSYHVSSRKSGKSFILH